MDNLMEISISEEVKNSLANLGRTEDLEFSPDESRLAIAGFSKNKILLVEINIEGSGSNKKVSLTESIEITCPQFRLPHGLSFLNNEALIVANRDGDALIFKLPPRGTDVKAIELGPIQIINSDSFHHIKTPGSVSASQIELDLYEVLICNNYVNYVTRHLLDGRDQYRVISSAVLLRNGIDIPDSVTMNKKRDWIAISNHNTHSVFLYENTSQLNSQSKPDEILGNVTYPHGLRFTSNDNFLLVADAGAPYVHLYSKAKEGWAGVCDPITSIRVMDDETFIRGRYNPQEGGPKGIDIDRKMRVLVTTSDQQVLAFHDLEKVLEEQESNIFNATSESYDRDNLDQKKIHRNQLNPDKLFNHNQLSHDKDFSRTILIRELERENCLHGLQESSLKAEYEQQIQRIYQTRSWKITAPLRWVKRKMLDLYVRIKRGKL